MFYMKKNTDLLQTCVYNDYFILSNVFASTYRNKDLPKEVFKTKKSLPKEIYFILNKIYPAALNVIAQTDGVKLTSKFTTSIIKLGKESKSKITATPGLTGGGINFDINLWLNKYNNKTFFKGYNNLKSTFNIKKYKSSSKLDKYFSKLIILVNTNIDKKNFIIENIFKKIGISRYTYLIINLKYFDFDFRKNNSLYIYNFPNKIFDKYHIEDLNKLFNNNIEFIINKKIELKKIRFY